jgi:hypothetical protein
MVHKQKYGHRNWFQVISMQQIAGSAGARGSEWSARPTCGAMWQVWDSHQSAHNPFCCNFGFLELPFSSIAQTLQSKPIAKSDACLETERYKAFHQMGSCS